MDFLKALEAERDRLTKRLEELHQQADKIAEEINGINTELRAMEAYQEAKEGKQKEARAPRKSSGPRGPRKTGMRESVMNVIASNPNGIGRAGIIDMMNAKEDKKMQQAISNVLVQLKKAGTVTSTDGKYAKA